MTNLYRHFNEAGALLYVGISLSAIHRLSAHSRGSDWFSEIAKVQIENFETRELAQIAEKRAIELERPKHNLRMVLKPKVVAKNKIEILRAEIKQTDRLLTFREVQALIGSTCKTAHTSLSLARRGMIKAVRINERTIRYTESSVLELISGRCKI